VQGVFGKEEDRASESDCCCWERNALDRISREARWAGSERHEDGVTGSNGPSIDVLRGKPVVRWCPLKLEH
jgi:hypothetical protein